MSKNKRGRVVSIKQPYLSPEKYIITQARALPVTECLITPEWKDAGICNIFIERKHKSGNVTIGMFLIDMYCLGLKGTHYAFNITAIEYADLKSKGGTLESCSYNLAHNIIYGAVAFAGDFGFKPAKDFAVSRFILEEDDERIALMQIECGLAGMPCYIPGPYDDDVKIKNITATLNRTAGPGNFRIMDVADGGDFEEDDHDDEEWDTDILREELVKSYAEFSKILKKINKVYDRLMRTPETVSMFKNSTIGDAYKITRDKSKVKNEYTDFDSNAQKEEYDLLKDMVIDGDYPRAIKGIKKAIIKYPGKPAFYDLLIPVYNFNKNYDEQDGLVKEIYEKFSDFLYTKVAYAHLLIDAGKGGEALAVFNGMPDLNYLFPDTKLYYVYEVADYYASMCRCFIALENIDSADLYMNALFKKKMIDKDSPDFVNKAIMELCNAKIKKMELMGLRLDDDQSIQADQELN